MSDPMENKYNGETIDEAIGYFPGELPVDAVGLWQIVPKGRDGFGLNGSALDDFVRRGILALLNANAVPVRHVPGSGYEWSIQKQYGQDRMTIAENIVDEWRAMPDDPLILCGDGVWFARQRPGTNYVKLD